MGSISSSRGSSRHRDRIHVSCNSCTGRGVHHCATWEAQFSGWEATNLALITSSCPFACVWPGDNFLFRKHLGIPLPRAPNNSTHVHLLLLGHEGESKGYKEIQSNFSALWRSRSEDCRASSFASNIDPCITRGGHSHKACQRAKAKRASRLP